MHHTTTRGTLALAGLLVAGLGVGCTKPDAARAPTSGQTLFASCSSCHGVHGEGNELVAAPAIAGLPAWYVEAQLEKFRTGSRGAHPDDYEGLRMRPMSRQMADEGEVKRVSEYVASLSHPTLARRLEGGDAAAGAGNYAVCMACHGADGKGNQAMNAPPLAGQADWYMLAQLKKFKAGIRGADPKDVTGATMRPMAGTLVDEQQMKNVIAHIETLGH